MGDASMPGECIGARGEKFTESASPSKFRVCTFVTNRIKTYNQLIFLELRDTMRRGEGVSRDSTADRFQIARCDRRKNQSNLHCVDSFEDRILIQNESNRQAKYFHSAARSIERGEGGLVKLRDFRPRAWSQQAATTQACCGMGIDFLFSIFTFRFFSLTFQCPKTRPCAVLESPLMERAGQSLRSALRRVARPEKPLDLLAAVWPLLVGRRLAAHTRPVAWSKGCVNVAVDQPQWQNQLESMGKDVRAEVNRWWGSELVREIRFVPDRPKRPEARYSIPKHRDDTRNSKTVTAGQSKRTSASDKEASRGTSADKKLSAALKELEPALNRIADTNLRGLIARVAGQYLGREAKK